MIIFILRDLVCVQQMPYKYLLMNKQMNTIKCMQLFICIFEDLHHDIFTSFFYLTSCETMIYNLLSSQTPCLVMLLNHFSGICQHHSLPLRVLVLHFHLSKSHPSYHVIFSYFLDVSSF